MPDPLITDAWTLAVIGCEVEGVTLDACLIFVPPGTDMAEVVRIGGEARIPHPYLRGAPPLRVRRRAWCSGLTSIPTIRCARWTRCLLTLVN